MKRLLVVGAVAVAGVVNGYDPCCDPLNFPYLYGCNIGHFVGTAEFLWVQPAGCNAPFALDDPRPFSPDITFGEFALPAGTTWKNPIPYKPGFRVGLGYLYGERCLDFQVSFTGLWCSREKCRTPAQGFWPAIGHPRYLRYRLNNPISVSGVELGQGAFAHSRTRIGYESIVAEFGRRTLARSCMKLRAAIGGQWVRIRDRHDALLVGTAAIVNAGVLTIQQQRHFIRAHSEGEAAGPQASFEARMGLGCGFGVSASTAAAVLVGQRKVRLAQDSLGQTVPEPSPLDFNQQLIDCQRDRCFAVPYWTGRLGLHYNRRCGNAFHAYLFVGYEWHAYIGALQRFSFTDTGGTNDELCYDFTLNGGVISLRIMI